MITNKDYNVDLAVLLDEKLMFEFAKEVYSDEKALGNKSTGDKIFKINFQPPAIMVSGISTLFLAEYPTELFDKLKFITKRETSWKYF